MGGIIMKSILVTGGNGFLGKHLCSKLKEQGNEVYSWDKKGDYIERVDLSYKEKVEMWFTYYLPHIDEVYNLAGIPSPAKYIKDPIGTSKISTIGLFNILDTAVKIKAKVLHASTVEVYEDFDWTDERACYREGKRMAETICYDYIRKYNLDIRIARMYSSYGPLMSKDDGRVIPVFIQKALKNEDIVVYGNTSRSFCYVDDMVNALINLMNQENRATVNLGATQEVSINYLAQLIVQLSNSKSKVITTKGLANDMKQKVRDEKLSGIGLEEGLLKTIEYFRGII